ARHRLRHGDESSFPCATVPRRRHRQPGHGPAPAIAPFLAIVAAFRAIRQRGTLHDKNAPVLPIPGSVAPGMARAVRPAEPRSPPCQGRHGHSGPDLEAAVLRLPLRAMRVLAPDPPPAGPVAPAPRLALLVTDAADPNRRRKRCRRAG